MDELALHCRRSGETVDLIVVCGQYASRAGPRHIIAYVGGALGPGRWRAERILIERPAEESASGSRATWRASARSTRRW